METMVYYTSPVVFKSPQRTLNETSGGKLGGRWRRSSKIRLDPFSTQRDLTERPTEAPGNWAGGGGCVFGIKGLEGLVHVKEEAAKLLDGNGKMGLQGGAAGDQTEGQLTFNPFAPDHGRRTKVVLFRTTELARQKRILAM